jgi:mycothiol synthase
MTTDTRVGDVTIEEVDSAMLSDDDMRDLMAFWHVLDEEAHPEDPPQTFESVANEVRIKPSFVRNRTFFGRDGSNAIVATAFAMWALTEDNQHLIDTSIRVRADHRRQGLGRALLARMIEAAEGGGRTTMVLRSTDRVPAGEAFARRIGAKLGLTQGMNRLVLAEADRELVRRWVDEGPRRAPGYSLVAIDGPYRDDLIEQIIDLSTVMNTAPREDLDQEDEIPTVEQAREMEAAHAQVHLERWYLAALHDASGQLVGWTEVGWVPDTPETVWQWGTGVRPEHRGHALGKWLKAVMLQRVLDERAGIIDIRTTNAESNDAMLGINHELGFRKLYTNLYWQVTVDRAKAYLAERVR